MESCIKGAIGRAKAIADLASKGYDVSVPISEHSPFDLVVSDGKRFFGRSSEI